MPGTRTGIMDRHRIGLVLDHEARAAAARVPNLDHPLRVAQAQAVQRVLRSALGELPAPLFQPVEHRKRRRLCRGRDSGHQHERRTSQSPRSEQHTSELQSLMRISYAVFCLKTKKQYYQMHRTFLNI